MNNQKLLNKIYSVENMMEIYQTKLSYKKSMGNDKINIRLFEKDKELYISHIRKRVLENSYKFTSYQEKLILKGKNKNPRVISKPTVKDKLTLIALKDILKELYKDEIKQELVQTYISKLKENLNNNPKYDYVMKLDIETYYDTIDHEVLLKLLERKINDVKILNLIKKAIKNPTVPLGQKAKDKNEIGIPQGLPISNILSEIYLHDLDKKFSNKESFFKYFRYVDDILILCKEKHFKNIENELRKDITEKKLKLHDLDKKEKSISQKLECGFTYLGYTYKNNLFSVKVNNVKKLERKLFDMFNRHKRDKEDISRFLWKLNIRITGIIDDNNKKYGWLFFYSQLEDKTSLFRLDNFIKKMCLKNDIDYSQVRTYVKTYYEINYKLNRTNYILNINNLSPQEKIDLILKISGKTITLEEDYNKVLKSLIYKERKELEHDIQNFS